MILLSKPKENANAFIVSSEVIGAAPEEVDRPILGQTRYYGGSWKIKEPFWSEYKGLVEKAFLCHLFPPVEKK